jgi:hypothetical protein
MQDVTVKREGEESADLAIPGGCPLCGGEVAVRVGPAGAHSCCIPCRWLSRPKVAMGEQGLAVAYGPSAKA